MNTIYIKLSLLFFCSACVWPCCWVMVYGMIRTVNQHWLTWTNFLQHQRDSWNVEDYITGCFFYLQFGLTENGEKLPRIEYHPVVTFPHSIPIFERQLRT